MAEKPEQDTESEPIPPRVLADFGGRRKIFDRRMKQRAISHEERRSKKDRRSGFDRRGALNQNDVDGAEKRSEIIYNSENED